MSLENITVENTPTRAAVHMDFKGSEEIHTIRLNKGDSGRSFKSGFDVDAIEQKIRTVDGGTITMLAQNFTEANVGTLDFEKRGADGKTSSRMTHDDVVAIGEKLKLSGLKDIAPGVTATLDKAIETSKQGSVSFKGAKAQMGGIG